MYVPLGPVWVWMVIMPSVAATVAPDMGVPLPETVTVPVRVPVGPTEQFGNLKAPMRVRQSHPPVAATYSCVYQKVQSSVGSTLIVL